MDDAAPVFVPLTDAERDLLREGLWQWLGPARATDACAAAIGFRDADDFYTQLERLHDALTHKSALIKADWNSVLSATAVVFADSVQGAGLDWTSVSSFTDGQTIALLRAAQRKVALAGSPADDPANPERQIFAFSGVLGPTRDGLGNADLVSHAIDLAAERARGGRPRLCYLPTAVGDDPAAIEATTAMLARRRPDVQVSVLRLFPRPSVPDVLAHLLDQDVVLVEGGSVVNLTAVWAAHDLPDALRQAWSSGVVLAGASAGSLCWHSGGPTDSYTETLTAYTDGLALLPHSNSVHDDLDDQPRRATYRRMVADGSLTHGWATEDGVGLHYVGRDLHEAVTTRPGARAWYVERAPEATDGHGYRERPLTPRLLTARRPSSTVAVARTALS